MQSWSFRLPWREDDFTARCSLLLYTKMGTPDFYFCGLFPAWFAKLRGSDRLPAFAAPRMTMMAVFARRILEAKSKQMAFPVGKTESSWQVVDRNWPFPRKGRRQEVGASKVRLAHSRKTDIEKCRFTEERIVESFHNMKPASRLGRAIESMESVSGHSAIGDQNTAAWPFLKAGASQIT